MINEAITKSYDIIIENQRNADTKANIFIVILAGFLAFIGNTPVSIIENGSLEMFQKFYLTMTLPLLLFILSLFPIINYKFKMRLINKEKIELNIFLWKSIIQCDDADIFIEEYKKKYGIERCNPSEHDLLKQIYVNSMILEYKCSIQKLAFFFIIQFILFFLSITITFLAFDNNPYYSLTLLIILEIFVYFNKQIIVTFNKWARKIKTSISILIRKNKNPR